MAERGADRAPSLRVRLTAGITVVVGVAMAAGAFGMVVAMRRSLTEEVANAARLRANDVSAMLRNTHPDGLVLAGSDDEAVQVIDASGRVVRASSNIAGESPLTSDGSARVKVAFDDDDFLAVSAPAPSSGSVVVARTLESVDESTQVVVRLLLIGAPLLIVVVGAAGWQVTGRALEPVEAIRREVDEVSAAELHRRVPEHGRSRELGRLAATMNRMLDRLEQSQARQRRFLSDAAHELRSPLASIRQHAEVAAAHPERVSQTDLATTVVEESVRLQDLVDDMLLLARVDEGHLRMRRPVDLDDVVFNEAARLRSAARRGANGRGLHIDTTAVSAARVAGDAAALSRVVRNLADNAARHAAARVAVSLADNGSDVVLTVDDDGAGIPAAERARVFERFVRLDDARDRDAGGAGLGLAVVASIVASHGGAVSASDAPLGGARIELRLPTFSGDSGREVHTQSDNEEGR